MKSFVEKTNRMLIILGVLIVVAAAISLFFLNEAQRLVVIIGAGLGILNLLVLAFFVNKNGGNRRK